MAALGAWVFGAYVALVCVSFGGGVMQGAVNYPAWSKIGAAEFPAFHADAERRLLPNFVVPFFLTLVPTVALVFVRPAAVPLGWVLAALVLNLAIMATTVGIAVPLQHRLGQGMDAAVLQRLIRVDRLLRLLPGLLLVLLTTTMTAIVATR